MFNPLEEPSEQEETLLAGTVDLQVTSIVSLLAIALLAGPVDPPLVLRAAVAMPLFTFLPGYAVLAALFPARATRESSDRPRLAGGPPLVARLALAVAVSLGVVPLVGIALSPVWGISAPATLVAVGSLTIAAAVVAVVRRANVAAHRRFVPLASLSTAFLLPGSSATRFALAAAVLGVAIAGVSVGFAASTDDPASTEFYLVNDSDGGVAVSGGTADEGARSVAIDHHADDSVTYTVVVREHSGASGVSTVARQTVSVSGPEQVFLAIPEADADADRIEYLLYEGKPSDNPDPDDAIRRLFVTGEESSD
jgi:uncharacterized membrane protein